MDLRLFLLRKKKSRYVHHSGPKQEIGLFLRQTAKHIPFALKSAEWGGAICTIDSGAGGTININGGTISGNKTTSRDGGALCLWNSAVTNITGGEIINNYANYCAGAISSRGTSTLNISGGLISGNSAVYSSVYCAIDGFSSGLSPLTISGNPVIRGNMRG
ncbi:MAG: hypothetical protein HUJ73_04755, partial [Eubacterium sp.]|nr:hypothetical protein [Eubacterium sp.]